MVVQVVEPADIEDFVTADEVAAGYITKEQGQNGADAIHDLEDRVTTLENSGGSGGGGGNPPIWVGPTYTVVSEPTEAAVNKGVQDWLANSKIDGGFRYPRSDLVFDFVGTAAFSKPIQFGTKAQTGQVQGAVIKGRKKRLTKLRANFNNAPLLQFDGQMRNWDISELTFESQYSDGESGARGILHLSNNDGNGANQDGAYRKVEFLGGWQYGFGFSGGAKANLNSEISFDGIACGNSSYFTDAFFRWGMQDQAQEGQFLNYAFRNTKFEGSHGCYFRINRGGNITLDGFNSWMHTGQANGGVPEGTMIYAPAGSRFDSEPLLRLYGWRPELRGTKSKAMDIAFGSTGLVDIRALDDTSNAFKVDEFEAYSFRGTAEVTIDNSRFGSWIGVYNTGARVIVRDCRSCPGQGNTGSPRSDDAKMTSLDTPPSGKQGLLRYGGGKPSMSGVVKSVPASVS
jgi:hypothetical protein